MTGQKPKKINRLEDELPEGLLVDGAWLGRHGYSRQLQNHYVSTGRLVQPARGLYRRPRGKLSWQQVVISLQNLLLPQPPTVGGRTALELQGYAHYLPQRQTKVHLYGPSPPPSWLFKLRLDAQFEYHNSRKLFGNESTIFTGVGLGWNAEKSPRSSNDESFSVQPWGQWNWPLAISTPDRAILELLDELPDRETFYQVDKLFEGLTSLSPRRLQKLLHDCKNVKVKRLFFFFADRHKHAWFKRLDRKDFDLGAGNRVLVKGGKLDRTYQITVPEDLNGVQ